MPARPWTTRTVRRGRHQEPTITISGGNAYSRSEDSEHGVHRLVRVSPFDAQARRQEPPSPAVEVMPELPDGVGVDIPSRGHRDAGLPLLRRGRPSTSTRTSSAVRLSPQAHPAWWSPARPSAASSRTGTTVCEDAPLPPGAAQDGGHLEKISDIRAYSSRSSGAARSAPTSSMPYQLVKGQPAPPTDQHINPVMDGGIDPVSSARLPEGQRHRQLGHEISRPNPPSRSSTRAFGIKGISFSFLSENGRIEARSG